MTSPPELYALIPTLEKWIRLLFHLRITGFNGWRDEDEQGLLADLLHVALERAKNLKDLPEPYRSERLVLLWKALPHERLKQLFGDLYEVSDPRRR